MRVADEAHLIGPPAARESYLSIEKLIDGRAPHPGAVHPSRLRLPVGERAVRRSLRGRRHRVRRSAAVRHPRDGAEGPGQGADGEGRRAGRARLSRRAAGREIPQGEGLRDRLSGADQGGGGRRRQGHAPRRQARRIRRGAGKRGARGAVGVRRPARADREIRHRAAPRRDAGVRRPPRQRDPSQRARLLAAAPPPEGDRGGARARHDRRGARRDGPRRDRSRARGRLSGRRHGRVHRRRRAGAAAGRLLVHGNEHAAAGRASGDRGDHRARSGRAAVPRRGGRDAAARAGRRAHRRPRGRSAALCRGPGAQFPALDRQARRAGIAGAARACGSIPASRRARSSRPTTIR